ncbi:MAG: hypothetical protein ABSG69_09665 [Candidatus Acidiferrum sp.]
MAPLAAVGAELFWGIGGGDLVGGGGQRLTLGGVFAFVGYGAFCGGFGHAISPWSFAKKRPPQKAAATTSFYHVTGI